MEFWIGLILGAVAVFVPETLFMLWALDKIYWMGVRDYVDGKVK